MNESRFFGEARNISPEKTLAETVAEMEEMDKRNENRGGKGTVIFENKGDEKMQIRISAEETDPLKKEGEPEE